MPKKKKNKNNAAAETKSDNSAALSSSSVAVGSSPVAAGPVDAKTEAKILFGVPGKLVPVPVSQIEKSQKCKLNNGLPPGEWAPEDKEAGETAERQVEKNTPSIALCPTGKESGLGGFFTKLPDGSLPKKDEFVAFYGGGDFVEIKKTAHTRESAYYMYDPGTNTAIDLQKSGSIARFFNCGIFQDGAPDRMDFDYFREGKKVSPTEVETTNLQAVRVGKKGGRPVVGLRLLRDPKDGEQAIYCYTTEPIPPHILRKKYGYKAFHQTGLALEMRERRVPVMLKVKFPVDAHEKLKLGGVAYTKCLSVETHSLQAALEEKEHNKPFPLETAVMYYLEGCENYAAESKRIREQLANEKPVTITEGEEKEDVLSVVKRDEKEDKKEDGYVEDVPPTEESMSSVTVSDEKATTNTNFVTAECLVHFSHVEVRASLALYYNPEIAVGAFGLAYNKSEPSKIKIFPASRRAWEITPGYGDQPLSYKEELRLMELRAMRNKMVQETNKIVLAGGVGKGASYHIIRKKLLKSVPEEGLQVLEAFQALERTLPSGAPLNQKLVDEIKNLREKRAQVADEDFSRGAVNTNSHEEEYIGKLLNQKMINLTGFLLQDALQLNTKEMSVGIESHPTRDDFVLIFKDESAIQTVVKYLQERGIYPKTDGNRIAFDCSMQNMLLLSEAFIRYSMQEVVELEEEQAAASTSGSPPLPVMAPALAGQTTDFSNPVPVAVQDIGQASAPALTN